MECNVISQTSLNLLELYLFKIQRHAIYTNLRALSLYNLHINIISHNHNEKDIFMYL